MLHCSNCLLVILAMIYQVSSHGNMKLPYTWNDTKMEGITKTNVGCLLNPEVSEAEEGDWPNIYGRKQCQNSWFTNATTIPGEQTIPDDMLGDNDKKRNRDRPRYSPGTAPIFSPCGTWGGNPNGCMQADPNEEYGGCCDNPKLVQAGSHCGGFSFGANVETMPQPDAPVTFWELGSIQEVAWWVGANHEGGYSYRLCKMPEDGPASLTEECFQQTPLDFVGDTHQVMYSRSKERTELPALRTREGTFPPGSQWTRNPFNSSRNEESSKRRGHAIDQIQVPADLEPGRYVLSFRWDCQKSPQIWSTCANVDIVGL